MKRQGIIDADYDEINSIYRLHIYISESSEVIIKVAESDLQSLIDELSHFRYAIKHISGPAHFSYGLCMDFEEETLTVHKNDECEFILNRSDILKSHILEDLKAAIECLYLKSRVRE